jgi:hypothetical protein
LVGWCGDRGNRGFIPPRNDGTVLHLRFPIQQSIASQPY